MARKSELNTMDLIKNIEEIRKACLRGKLTVQEGKLQVSLFNSTISSVRVLLEHARSTGRLTEGSTTLGAFTVKDGN